MKNIYYLAYQLLKAIHGVAFRVSYKTQNLSYKMLDKSGGRRCKRKPLTAIYKFIKTFR